MSARLGGQRDSAAIFAAASWVAQRFRSAIAVPARARSVHTVMCLVPPGIPRSTGITQALRRSGRHCVRLFFMAEILPCRRERLPRQSSLLGLAMG